MLRSKTYGRVFNHSLFALAICAGVSTQAVPIYWTDWQTGATGPGSAFTGTGTITTPTSSVTVTYSNLQGISFFNDGVGGETDYWRQGSSGSLGRNPARSPYTSATVDNIPTGTDMIALSKAGDQTLTFSEAIANPVFSFISLNANFWAFDHDFDILSFGNASDGNDIGYWGSGTATKTVVVVAGVTEYRLSGSGEPHGTIQFKEEVSSITWRSQNNENWNGFTIGVEGTAAEIPDGGGLFIPALLTMGGLLYSRRRLQS